MGKAIQELVVTVNYWTRRNGRPVVEQREFVVYEPEGFEVDPFPSAEVILRSTEKGGDS